MLTEINVDGRVYVDKEELKKLIGEHKCETLKGEKHGFIEKNEERRRAGYMALNHLQSVIFSDEAMDAAKKRVDEMKKKRVIIAFTTDKSGERKMDYFAAWIKMKSDLPEKVRKQLQEIGLKEEESAPMFASDWNDAMVFTDPEFAKIQAERVKAFFNDGDDVVALPYADVQTEKLRRFLLAIFSGDDDHAAD